MSRSGDVPPTPPISIVIDGRSAVVHADVSVAAALMDAGVAAFRRSVKGDARSPLCGMGVCHECRVTIDGIAHRRACLVTTRSGMRIETTPATAQRDR